MIIPGQARVNSNPTNVALATLFKIISIHYFVHTLGAITQICNHTAHAAGVILYIVETHTQHMMQQKSLCIIVNTHHLQQVSLHIYVHIRHMMQLVYLQITYSERSDLSRLLRPIPRWPQTNACLVLFHSCTGRSLYSFIFNQGRIK